MIDKINDIKKALENKAYLSALALTLTLPDICGKVAYPKLRSGERYIKWYDEYIGKFDRRATCSFPVRDGKQSHCQNRAGYKSCDPFTNPQNCEFYVDKDEVLFTADMCYQLRCAFLHSGSDDINSKNKLIDEFQLQISDNGLETGGAHSLSCSWINGDVEHKKAQIRLDVTQLCFTIYKAAEVFYENNKDTFDFTEAHISLFDIDEWAKNYGSISMSSKED